LDGYFGFFSVTSFLLLLETAEVLFSHASHRFEGNAPTFPNVLVSRFQLITLSLNRCQTAEIFFDALLSFFSIELRAARSERLESWA